jgi:hypothetical protein
MKHRKQAPLRSDIAWSTPDRIGVFGGKSQRFRCWSLHPVDVVAARAEKEFKRQLPINATGAIGAICCELGLPWQVCRGRAPSVWSVTFLKKAAIRWL